MRDLAGNAGRFLALHYRNHPLLQPNAWDAGSAKLLEKLGFEAIATTSSGFAATLGRLDGTATHDEVLAHCELLAGAVGVPVAADTENGFADDPETVAETVTRAARTGLAGCSIEDFTGDRDDPIYEFSLAVDRVAAAAEAAHSGAAHLVLTARAENLLHGGDLDDAILRLQAFQEAGADVLFAPGLRSLDDVRGVVSSVDLPVNVLAFPGCPSVEALAEAGVSRVSVGGAFAYAAYSALVDMAGALRDEGTFSYWEALSRARGTIRAAFE